jgi:hypothetical protein
MALPEANRGTEMEFFIGQTVQYTHPSGTFVCKVESIRGDTIGLRSAYGIGWISLTDPRVTITRELGKITRIEWKGEMKFIKGQKFLKDRNLFRTTATIEATGPKRTRIYFFTEPKTTNPRNPGPKWNSRTFDTEQVQDYLDDNGYVKA